MMDYDFLVDRVRYTKTGKVVTSESITCLPERRLFRFRRALESAYQTSRPFLVCYHCGGTLKLRNSGGGSGMHFYHISSDIECPRQNERNFTKKEICALKYNGAKESNTHYLLKHRIASFLKKDKLCEEGSVLVESRIKDKKNAKKFRQPDVQAVYNDKKVVVEIQLSTTFLSEIVGREIFYENNQRFILWVFKKYDPGNASFSEKDIIWENSGNAFVFDDEAISRSNLNEELTLKCYFPRSIIGVVGVEIEWDYAWVTLDQLTWDTESYRVYYRDWKEENDDLLRLYASRKLARDFEDYVFWASKKWEAIAGSDDFTAFEREDRRKLSSLRRRFVQNGTPLPEKINGFVRVVETLSDLRDGEIRFSRYNSLKAMVTNTVEHYKDYSQFVFIACKEWGFGDEFMKVTKKGKRSGFANKVDAYKAERPKQCEVGRAALDYLFPGVISS